jgi:hypothetical protein
LAQAIVSFRADRDGPASAAAGYRSAVDQQFGLKVERK